MGRKVGSEGFRRRMGLQLGSPATAVTRRFEWECPAWDAGARRRCERPTCGGLRAQPGMVVAERLSALPIPSSVHDLRIPAEDAQVRVVGEDAIAFQARDSRVGAD